MSPGRHAGAVQEADVSEETASEDPESLPPTWHEEVKECFKSMAPKIYRFLLRFTQGDHELAVVLVQETFKEAALKRNWGKLRTRPDAGRKAWLIRVARSRAIGCIFLRGACFLDVSVMRRG